MKDLMLDIETLGNGSNAVITSISAMFFDFEKEERGRKYQEFISIDSCLRAGMKVSGETLKWWLRQNEQTRQQISEKKGLDIFFVLQDFGDWLNGNPEDKNIHVWGNSNRFDCGILSDAYRIFGLKIPWDFRKERDVRTLVSLAPEFKDNWTFTGIPHDGLDDCENQIGYCKQTWNALKS